MNGKNKNKRFAIAERKSLSFRWQYRDLPRDPINDTAGGNGKAICTKYASSGNR